MTLCAHKWLLLNVFSILSMSCPDSQAISPCLIGNCVLHNACWITLCFLVLSGVETWQPLLPEEFIFSLKSLHSVTQGREGELLFIPTLQTREARLHRNHSKACNWTQICWIPREYLMRMTTLLILRAGELVMIHWLVPHVSSCHLLSFSRQATTGEIGLSLNCESPGNTPGGSKSPTNPKFRSQHRKLMSLSKLPSGCLEPLPSHRFNSLYTLWKM